MKKILILKIMIIGLYLNTYSQVDYNEIDSIKSSISYSNLDTLKWYAVGLSYTSYPKDTYSLNGVEIKKKKYDYYKKIWDNILICKPCYLMVYNEIDSLIWEAVQYTDCVVGLYIDYFPNGNIKTIGQYKENISTNWNELSKFCCVKNGIWIYYDINGNLLKKEKYIDNILQ